MEQQTYSVGELARLSGVSVRTLHHYESLGLVVPARQANGYRAYAQADVERLQFVLLLRACGLGLATIRDVMGGQPFDAAEVLSAHVEELVQRRNEIDVLIRTARKTLLTMKGEATMTNRERFEGIKRKAVEDNERTFGKEARARHGNDAVDAANGRLLAMDEETWNNMNALEEAIIAQLRVAMDTGDACGDEAHELARMHARWIELHWGEGAYSVEAHRGLVQAYLADDRFRDYYDSRAGAGATEFLVAALGQCL